MTKSRSAVRSGGSFFRKYRAVLIVGAVVIGLFVWRTELLKAFGILEQANVMEVKGGGGRTNKNSPTGKTGRNAGGGKGNDVKVNTKNIPNGAKLGKKTCSFNVSKFEFQCEQVILLPNTQTGQTP